MVSVRPHHSAYACWASVFLSGSNSSMRLLGQVGSFSSVSVSHAMGLRPLAFLISNERQPGSSGELGYAVS